jgi:hypothetical protein
MLQHEELLSALALNAVENSRMEVLHLKGVLWSCSLVGPTIGAYLLMLSTDVGLCCLSRVQWVKGSINSHPVSVVSVAIV